MGPLPCWQLSNSRLGHLYPMAGLSLYQSIKLHGMLVNFIKCFKNTIISSFPLLAYTSTSKTKHFKYYYSSRGPHFRWLVSNVADGKMQDIQQHYLAHGFYSLNFATSLIFFPHYGHILLS